MSQENVEILRRAYEIVAETGEMNEEVAHPDFVWNMGTTENWPEAPTYEGIDGANAFLREWTGAWEGWTNQIEALHEAGDKIVAIVHQSGRQRTTGVLLDMRFAQLWTFRDGKASRMDMYVDRAAALEAAGLSE